MRRSLAPSQNSNDCDPSPISGPSIMAVAEAKMKADRDRLQAKKNPVVSLDFAEDPDLLPVSNDPFISNPTSSNAHSPTIQNMARFFAVVWAKVSTRKHKKWEGDAFLAVRGRAATLFDTDGKPMGRSTGFQLKQLDALEDGSQLIVCGKEIEVQNEISKEEFDNSLSEVVPAAKEENEGDMVPLKRKACDSIPVKPFIQPLRDENGITKKKRIENNGSLYNPDAEDALIMPEPNENHQLRFNENELSIMKVVVDPRLTQHLRPHQREGVKFLYECVTGMKDVECFGAILADEMGLGKSLQCISLIWTLLKQSPYGSKSLIKKVLLVCPCSLVQNWMAEFKKWLGDERLKIVALTKAQDLRTFEQTWRNNPVLIISYDMAKRYVEQLDEMSFDLMVCDEGHRLKNATIKTTAALSSLNVKRKVLLSGTPIQNDLQELYSLINFVNPGMLGPSGYFRDRFEEPIVAGQQPNASRLERQLAEERLAALQKHTQQCLLRRAADLNQEYLPPKHEYTLFCKPSEVQMALYDRLLHTREMEKILETTTFSAKHLACIDFLRKLCNHPVLIYQSIQDKDLSQQTSNIYQEMESEFPEDFIENGTCVEHSGKMAVLCDLLEAVSELKSQKIVVVSNYTRTLDMLDAYCDAVHYPSLRLDGQTPAVERQRLVKQFNSQNDQTMVFLLSSKAGGVGLNLIGASRIVLFDVDWNPANDLQAMARVWRDGQKNTCHIYRLVTTGTIEEKIFQRQIKKLSLSSTVVDGDLENGAFTKPNFSSDDLRDLFTLHRDTSCQTHDLFCQCSAIGDIKEQREKRLQFSDDDPSKFSPAIENVCSWRHVRGDVDCPSHMESAGHCLENLCQNPQRSLTFVFEKYNVKEQEENVV